MPTSTSQRLHQIDVQLSCLQTKFGRDHGQLMEEHAKHREALSDELARVQALPADAPPTEEEARHLASLLAEIRSHDSLTKAAAVSAATERCDSVRLLTA